MRRKRLLAWLFCVCASVCASGQSHSSALTVDESRSQIHFSDNEITPLLSIDNPGREATTAKVRAELLDPADNVRASGEIEARLHEGLNEISVRLGGWTQKPDEWNDSIWYRVRYRVIPMQAGVTGTEGVLALTAKADGLFDLRVVTSKRTVPGMPFRVRVYTQSLATLLPMAGVKVSAELESDEEEAKLQVASVTNHRGYAQLEFNVPNEGWGGSASLTVVARKGQVVREATDTVDLVGHWSFFITTDKPLYQPGQTVHIRALLHDWTRHAVAAAPLTFTIEDEENTLAFRATAVTSRFGVARADWDVPESLLLGNYQIKVAGGTDDTEEEVGQQAIRISRYELPTFTVNVAPDRSYYLPGQNADVSVRGDYLFGKPVTKGHVKVVRETVRNWNYKAQRWDTTEEQKWEGETDDAGKFVAHIDLSREHEDMSDADRFRDLDYGAYFTDSSTGKTEQRRFRVRVTRDPIHLYIIESGNAVGQLPLEFYVSASYADGSPAQCEVAIYAGSPDEDKAGAFLRSVKTNRYGVAKVRGLNLPPLPEVKSQYNPKARIVLEGRDREGRRGREAQDFWAVDDRLMIQVQTGAALYPPNKPVDVEIHTNRKDANLLLDVLHDGRVLQSEPVRVHNGYAYVLLPYSPDFQGEVTIAAYAPLESQNRWDVPIGSRTILYPHDPALKMTAKFDHATYRPGDDAVLDVRVRGVDGAPVEAALGSVIFDQAVEERARTDNEFGKSRGYGFYDSFSNYWYQPAELGGLKRSELDRLDVSQPFNDDLQLAAEVLLVNRWGSDPPLVFGGAEYPDAVGATFHPLIELEVAPVKAALDSVYEKGMSYPHDEASLRRMLHEAGVDFDKVLDPWGAPFRPKFLIQQSYAVVELVSSGPDKKPGTGDDVTALSVSRRYFRRTAEAIKKAMMEYHAHTGAYIRDVETLKRELAKSGIDWDLLRDPWKQPYLPQFGISDSRYTLTVLSGGPDGKFETMPSSDDFPVWTESSDYFADTAVKIDSALARNFATTGNFPQNENEFYKILDGASIPRKLLVDAWGGHPGLVFDTHARFADRVVMDYSDVEGESQTRTSTQPETAGFSFIHLYSPGRDGIPHNADDFELAAFSREIARQNSTMLEPAKTPSAVALSGGSGAITGVVSDPTGAVVAGAKVTAQMYSAHFEMTSDPAGRYMFRNLPTGLYTVSAEVRGFRTAVVNRVPVKSLTTTELNLRMTLGTTSEVVEVQAEAVVLQTSSSMVASVSRSALPHTEGGPIATPRLREFFPETLLWEPLLETDARGNSRVRFRFADSITNWKLSLIASTEDGQIGLLDSGIKTFQPFFLEHEPPQVLTQGDEIALPIVLRNYLEKSQTLRVEMKSEPWFKMLSPAQRETSVAAGESERTVFDFRVTGAIGEVKQRVTAANRETGDAVEKKLRIHPDGEPRTVTSSRLFGGSGEPAVALDIDIPDNAMPGSVEAELKLYPNLMAHVLESSRSLLERPYGCGEQTISSTYPNVMLMRLYKQAGKPEDAIYRAALRFARLGYARLLSYQHEDGGISVWKQDKPDLALTAYALRFLTDAREFVEVDPEVVVQARRWLLRQQATNGSWHDDVSLTSYILLGIRKSKIVSDAQVQSALAPEPVGAALDRGLDYLRRHWSVLSDPYGLAEVALAAFQSGDITLGGQVNARLRTLIHREGDSSYWALERNTLFYGWGTAGRVETTALVAQALTMGASAGADESGANKRDNLDDCQLIEQGLIFLIEKQDGFGSWYSGQTTINVLESLLLLAQSPAGADTPAKVAEILVNGEKAGSVKLPGPHEIAAPLLIDLSRFVRAGRNHISIVRSGESSAASVQAVARYYIPWNQSTARSETGRRTGDSDALALRVTYDATQVKLDQEIHCKVHAERIGFRGYGMLLAEIGLPPGAVVDRASLEKVMAGSVWEVSQYEIRPDRLVVYVWPRAGGTDFEFNFRPRYGMDALTAPSVLYDYYNPEAQVVVQPARIEVR